MPDIISVVLLSLVAIIWGITNALMKQGAEGIERCSSSSKSWARNLLEEIKFLLKNWKYLLFYGINQLGSLLYYYSLGYCDLAVAGPLTNTMTFIVTYVADNFMFGHKNSNNTYEKVGLCCICLGILLCMSSV